MITTFRDEYAFLSNFYYAPVHFDDVLYATVEHAYQAAKTLDLGERQLVRAAQTPKQAKLLGREVRKRPDWDDMRVTVMLGLLRQKFAFGKPLAQRLLDTGEEEIVEGNWWNDTFWGVCNGVGENVLGKLLMVVRDDLRILTHPPTT